MMYKRNICLRPEVGKFLAGRLADHVVSICPGRLWLRLMPKARLEKLHGEAWREAMIVRSLAYHLIGTPHAAFGVQQKSRAEDAARRVAFEIARRGN